MGESRRHRRNRSIRLHTLLAERLLTMRRLLIVACLLFLSLARIAPAAAEDPLPKKVKESIRRGVRFLREQEDGKGNFEHTGEGIARARPGGMTALAVVALLNAGVPADDPLIHRCLRYLRKLPPRDSYTVGLQTMAFCLAGDKQDRVLVQRNLDWIVKQRMPGGWAYNLDPSMRKFGPDHSINQYILLGVDEAARAGFQVDQKMLKALRDHYAANRSGQWTYRESGRSRLTMTAAGLSNLLTTHRLIEGKQRQGTTVKAALQFLGDSFPANIQTARKDGAFPHAFSCLHGIKRVGVLTGQRSLGKRDWYRIGCEYLVATQEKNGSWEGRANDLDRWPVVASSFALIFLPEPPKK